MVDGNIEEDDSGLSYMEIEGFTLWQFLVNNNIKEEDRYFNQKSEDKDIDPLPF
ncbi:hypothetical protein [Flammeovirga kamogawensis]|uniref:Uncharacterized protein n=1 Tax=Flammeovirga kamogawensis TaxID=373891 RepID=A0ABX8GXK7_9BACT|nr:hypothetical protein [Flammeovirga kamogawensis]MBB6460933.1 hypothetical protein [Flammeovirga kamogawensis]QWG08276.1 hypothetical protein KM029_04890 [Flammeovirga kamogawensis]